MSIEKQEWIMIKQWEIKGKEGILEDYAVFDEGCGCCTESKTPTKEDLDILEKHLDEQQELISYLRDKFNLK